MPTPAQVQSNAANGLPDWYEPEAPAAAPPQAATDWDTFDRAPAAAPAVPQTQTANPVRDPSWPSWYQPESAPSRATSNWDEFDPPIDTVNVTADRNPVDSTLGDIAANIGTGVARLPGAVFGLPHMVGHTVNWAQAQFDNGLNYVFGNPAREIGADVDAKDPVMKVLPSSQDIDNGVFKGISAIAGREVDPYIPSSFIGKLAQAAVTGGLAGWVDPAAAVGAFKAGAPLAEALTGASMARTATAAAAANATDQAFPDSPGLAATAAFLAHAGTGAAGTIARVGGGVAADAVRQVFSPSAQGETEAGRALANVDNAQPGLANPTPTDLAASTSGVRSATDDIGPGQEPWQAGAALRDTLQQRVNSLEQARTAATAPLLQARDTSPTPINTDPVFAMIGKKLNVAAGAQQDALQGALSDLHLPDGSPREDAEQLAAARTAINSRITAATRAGDNASATHLLDVRSALDTQINNAVPEAGQYTSTYADMSKPLDPTQYGPVAKVLDRDQFNSRYTFPDERIPDLFLRSSATRSDISQLTSAFGGDQNAALGALQDHLAGVAQRAVQPDGTLDTGAFDKAMQPYQKSLGNLSMYFPALAQKFATAKAAQSTLDTMQAQRGLSDAVSAGALRDGAGVVTGPSFGKWLRSNQDTISKTQSPGAVMRLQSIGSALQNTHPGELAETLRTEWAPAAIGMATGGLEGGVLGTLLHKSTQAAFGGLDAKRQAAFSSAIEQATLDPAYAARLSAQAAKRGQGVSPVRGLVRAIAATPLAVNAGAPGGN